MAFVERLREAGLIVVREDWLNRDDAMSGAEIEEAFG